MSTFSLDEFVAEVQNSPADFKAWWLDQRSKAADPETWPLELPESNAGTFYEAFVDYLYHVHGNED